MKFGIGGKEWSPYEVCEGFDFTSNRFNINIKFT